MTHCPKRISISSDEMQEAIAEGMRTTIDKYRTDIRYMDCQLKDLHDKVDELKILVEDCAGAHRLNKYYMRVPIKQNPDNTRYLKVRDHEV